MFFEDEKDIIENNIDMEISDDETTSWDILGDDDADDLVSIKETATKAETLSTANTTVGNSELSSVDFADELELIDDDILGDDSEVDDDELARILNEDSAPTKQKAFDAFGTADADILGDDSEAQEEVLDYAETQYADNEQQTDIYEEEQEAVGYQAPQEPQASEEEFYQEPVVKQSKKQTSPLMIAIFFAALVVGGVYFLLGYTKDKGLNQDKLPNADTNVQQETQEVVEDPEQQEDSQENIPVVNEENVDLIKPDVPEKKEVINVSSTGKVNPFVPIRKYVAVPPITTRYNYDLGGVPKAPLAYGVKDVGTTKLMTISVSGIMYDEIKPSAIITLDNNDYFVQKGDKLDDYRVVDITRNDVKIALGKNIYKANLGEEFKINSFYGNAEYVSDQYGNTRQYHAVKEGLGGSTTTSSRRSSSRSHSSNHTSEEDIKIETYK